MSNSPGTLTSIRWSAIFPWLILVRAARVSLMVRVIVLALAGVLLTQLGWDLLDRTLLEDRPEATPWLARATNAPPGWLSGAALELDADHDPEIRLVASRSPLARGWAWASQPLFQMFRVDAWRNWLGLLLAGAWAIAVWALFGGAIARIAAIYLTRGEAIGPVAALRSAMVSWPSTAAAPALALLALLLLALPLIVAGLLVQLDLFALLLGVVWFVIILVGVAMAIVGLGLALGWPLMWSTVAVERTDAFDGISRAYAYVYQRPLHALFFVAVAGVLGLLVQTVVSLFVDYSLTAAHWAVSSGAGEVRTAELLGPAHNDDSLGALGRGGAKAMRFWNHGFTWIAASFPMAYLFPAATGIYLLMRRYIDATEMTEVVFDEGEPERGLPTLVNDPATGVPRVDDPAPGTSGVPPAPSPPTPPAP